ncbi:hypothetical protein H8E52_00795 [bacterium]|nr:hypothetical protein [bacterium]
MDIFEEMAKKNDASVSKTLYGYAAWFHNSPFMVLGEATNMELPDGIPHFQLIVEEVVKFDRAVCLDGEIAVEDTLILDGRVAWVERDNSIQLGVTRSDVIRNPRALVSISLSVKAMNEINCKCDTLTLASFTPATGDDTISFKYIRAFIKDLGESKIGYFEIKIQDLVEPKSLEEWFDLIVRSRVG